MSHSTPSKSMFLKKRYHYNHNGTAQEYQHGTSYNTIIGCGNFYRPSHSIGAYDWTRIHKYKHEMQQNEK